MQDQPADLAQRVARLEAVEGVRRTLSDYVLALDSGQLDALGQLFTEDAVFEMVGLGPRDGIYHGREAIIRDFYGRLRSAGDPHSSFGSGHYATNQQVEVNGTEATSIAYFVEVVGRGGQNASLLGGLYQHRLRYEGERWRFAAKRITVTFRAVLPLEQVETRRFIEVLDRAV
jgi:hypothetical protein